MTFGNSTCVTSYAGVACFGVFFNYRGEKHRDHPGVDCHSNANFNPDIAGIGVVTSFALTAIITTLASILASVLDNIASKPTSLLPTRWQPQDVSSAVRKRCEFYRRILERLILNLADQQLVTGYALLIASWVKFHSNPVLRGDWKGLESNGLPNLWLPNAQFALVCFLCMASSSSHLACVLVLREYMEQHKSAAKLRIFLIVIFALFLTVTIALASSFTPYFAWIVVQIGENTFYRDKYPPIRAQIIMISLAIAIPLIAILGLFWLCTLQIVPSFKESVQRRLRKFFKWIRRWLGLSKLWHFCIRALPARWRGSFTVFVKRTFWFLIIGNEFIIFMIQIVLATLSVVWIALQRLATPPSYTSPYYKDPELCSLHHIAGNEQWVNFGQLLPLVLLVLPILLLIASYIEQKDDDRNSKGYAPVSASEWSPRLNRRFSSRRSTFNEESELDLLDSQHRRRDSDANVSSPFGRAYYGRHESSGSLASFGATSYRYSEVPSSIPVQSAFTPDPTVSRPQGGSMGRIVGFSTGVDEQQYPIGSSSRW